MITNIHLNSISIFDQLLDFFYSFISEEDCRLCARVMLARGQLMDGLQDFGGEARPAIIHRWINDTPRYSRVICSDCWQGLSSETPLMGFYEQDGERSFAIVSGAPYSGEMRSLIHSLKYEGDRLLAPDLAAIMLNGWRMGSIFLNQKNAVLVPVPLHWRKGMERGFNQADLLANEASKVLDIPVLRGAIKRRRATTPQQSLEKAERFKNVENAFHGNPSKLMGRAVVLVDDVCTSGATLAECAREVNRCGATKVVALTVARTMLRAGRDSGINRLRHEQKD
ncbi:MAG: ComF family protein [Cyanobacteria bacterium SZAS-4]|nr:ComF family protein [Cyanobacteria bacterium SZAS-4]